MSNLTALETRLMDALADLWIEGVDRNPDAFEGVVAKALHCATGSRDWFVGRLRNDVRPDAYGRRSLRVVE